MEKLSRTKKYAQLRNNLKTIENISEEIKKIEQEEAIDKVEVVENSFKDQNDFNIDVSDIDDKKDEQNDFLNIDDLINEEIKENFKEDQKDEDTLLDLDQLINQDSDNSESVFDSVEASDELSELDDFSKTLSYEISEILRKTSIKLDSPQDDIIPILSTDEEVDKIDVIEDLKPNTNSENLKDENDNEETLENTTVIDSLEMLKAEKEVEFLDAEKLLQETNQNDTTDTNTSVYVFNNDEKDEEFEPKPNKILNILLIILIIVLIIALASMAYLILVTKGYIQ